MDYLAAVLGIAGTIFFAMKKWYSLGWVLLMVSAAIWVYVGVVSGVHGLIFSGGAYFIVQLVGLINSRK